MHPTWTPVLAAGAVVAPEAALAAEDACTCLRAPTVAGIAL